MNRRKFISAMAGTVAAAQMAHLSRRASAAQARPVQVVVWDEQQPEQKQAYENYLGTAIADYLKNRPGFAVRSVAFSDPEQGLGDNVLNNADVLVYWSHFRTNPAVTLANARKVVDRIKGGKLSMITLHSAHWSEPFVQAMRDRAADDALKDLSNDQRKSAVITYVTPKRFVVPKRSDPLTPSSKREMGADGKPHIEITLPCCVFPAFRADGKPSHVTTVLPEHPIARGIPKSWDIPQTEMYDEPFHVPPPDQVVFEERWDGGEHFRSGCVWKIGRGKIFYFRPGHEIYPVYKQELPLRVIENACGWLAQKQDDV